jgi:hypothetical protein
MPSSFNSDAFSRAGPAVGTINVIVMKLFQKKISGAVEQPPDESMHNRRRPIRLFFHANGY